MVIAKERINDQYVPSRAAAALLGIHPAAIQKLFQAGRLPAEKIANRWFVRREVLERFALTYDGRRGRPRRRR